jgi:hypothetical protein
LQDRLLFIRLSDDELYKTKISEWEDLTEDDGETNGTEDKPKNCSTSLSTTLKDLNKKDEVTPGYTKDKRFRDIAGNDHSKQNTSIICGLC